MRHLTLLTLACLALASMASASTSPVRWLHHTVAPAGDATVAIAEAELAQGIPSATVSLVCKPDDANPEGFTISSTGNGSFTIEAPAPAGLLYGSYALLRDTTPRTEAPACSLRMLNHWDNPDGTVERGYAGRSIWKWDSPLTDADRETVRQYARANASVGINCTVLNNVNASPRMLSSQFIKRAAEYADLLRPYNIRVMVSVNFASPRALGDLDTADPLDPAVQKWWNDKADEIYSLIPDFGGFLVKANSEGEPGPMDFGRTHADGANMMARALQPHNGRVIWRSFVYSPSDADRAKQAYNEFQPLDGQFLPNVMVQIKNGPIDFQPREPHSPLFSALPNTEKTAELQITQEYLGHSNHLAFLAPMWSEFLEAALIPGFSGIAGVANIGDHPEWTAHPLAQANWYAFGRLAWDHSLTPEAIAREFIRLAVVKDPAPSEVIDSLTAMMTASHEAVVDYMMPLGLHHIFAWGHHYGPQPWCEVPGAREDWLPRYYHRADSKGVGFDRTPSGSNATGQYAEPYRSLYADRHACPPEYLLWFHHVGWDEPLSTGRTLWEELCHRYQRGVEKAHGFEETWIAAAPYVEPAMHADVAARLRTQCRDAEWWRDACLAYFGDIAGKQLPEGYPKPAHTLDHYRKIDLGITNYECPSPQLLDSIR